MAQECQVCRHPDVFTINERLVGIGGKTSLRNIAKQFDVNYQAVNRHKAHIPELMAKAAEAMEIADADALMDQVRSLQRRALSILDKAEEAGELRTALSAIAQARGNLELLAKLLGELSDAPQINLTISPEWLELRAVIVQALEPHEEARESVLAAIEGIGNGRAS
jgi:hypothetical protein